MEYLKTIHEFTIEDFTIFEETGDISILRKKKGIIYTKKQNERLQSEINEVLKSISDMFGDSNEDMKIANDGKLLFYFQKTTLCQEVMSKILLYIHFDSVVKKDANGLKLLEMTLNDEYRKVFKDEVGREFEGTDKDIRDFGNKLQFYLGRYEKENKGRETKEDKGVKVSALIPKLERALGRITINRQLKMFALKGYYDEAVQMNKDNG